MLLPDIPGLMLWLIEFDSQLSHPDRLDTRGLLYDSNHRVCLLQDLLDILNINAMPQR